MVPSRLVARRDASVSWPQVMAERGSRTRARATPGRRLEAADRLSVTGDLVYLVWRHKLWWMVPLLVAMVVLAVLIVLEATPIGPLLYPVF